MTWHPPLAILGEATAPAETEFGGKEKAIAGYPPEEPPAPPREVQWAWVQQHPPPPLVAPPPPRPPTLLQRNLRGRLYNTENFRFQNYDSLLLSRFFFSMLFLYLSSTLLHLLDSLCFDEFLLNFFLPEPDSYPTFETPVSTSEGPFTINVAERRRWRREEQMKNADLIIFFIIVIIFCAT